MLSPFSTWITFGPPFGALLGSFWEVIWPPRSLKPVSKVPLGCPKADSNTVFLSPRALQERSKRAPGCQDSSKSSPRGPRIDIRAVLVPVWHRCSSPFRVILSAESGVESRERERAEQKANHQEDPRGFQKCPRSAAQAVRPLQ